MASDMGEDVKSLMRDAAARSKIRLENYVGGDIGLPTLKDIMQELGKPGRDPREKFEAFKFSDEARTVDDLREGMRLPGIVTNVTAFGAFIDIGVHQDGLAHISELADFFVKDPKEAVRPGQKVSAYVLEVDRARKRISLSLKSNPAKRARNSEKPAGDGNRARQKGGSGGRGKFGGSAGGGFNSFGDALSKLGK